jgi:hypothetical protein
LTAKPAPLSLPVYQQVSFRHGGIRMARFAPDGKTMIYSAAWEDRIRPANTRLTAGGKRV